MRTYSGFSCQSALVNFVFLYLQSMDKKKLSVGETNAPIGAQKMDHGAKLGELGNYTIVVATETAKHQTVVLIN